MEEYTTVIKPKDKLLEVNLKEIWQYRDLFSMFVKRDIVTQYKQTILGPAWFFIQPLFTMAMYMLVFGGIAGISTDGLPQALFYLSGILCWQYFSDCLNKTSNTFLNNQGIFGKVYFPRLIVPLSVVASNLLRLGIQLSLFVAVYMYYLVTGAPVRPNLYALLFPVLVVMLAGLALGFGIIISSLTTKYRDLQYLVSFGVGLWMYATPVIYPVSSIPEKWRWVANVNPVTPIIETFRKGFLGAGDASWARLAYSFGFMLVVLLIGVVIFNRVEKTFIDTV